MYRKEDSRIGHPLFDFCIFIHFILFTIIKFKNSEMIKHVDSNRNMYCCISQHVQVNL